MKFKIIEVSIRDLTQNYVNDNVEGVTGYNGLLDIRPKYQREFIYKDKQQAEVINTVNKGYPLSLLQWVKKSDGTFEVLDGQQRTLSICEYVAGVFAINNDESFARYFSNLEQDEQDKILDYKLMIQVCEGTDKEKLDWFKIVNIAGEKLTTQELRNAVYSGTWLSNAKAYFHAATGLTTDYLKGSAIRQEYLETALKWISGGNIEQYMASHQHEPNANELTEYFAAVIDWVEATFPIYRKEMKGVDFGTLYNEFKPKPETEPLDTTVLETEISKLMADEDVTNKSGIYPYVLTRNKKLLSIRAFNDKMKREVYEHQNGICTACNDEFKINKMEADHITPWHAGGTTTADNCQMLCQSCNRTKSGK